MDRRKFSKSLMLLPVGAAIANLPLPERASGQTALNTEILNTSMSTIGPCIAHIANGVGTTTDYATIASEMASVISMLQQADFDTTFKSQVQSLINTNEAAFAATISPESFAQMCQKAGAPYVPNYPISTLEHVFSQLPQFTIPPNLPPNIASGWVLSNIKSCTQALANSGVVPFLEDGMDGEIDYANSLPSGTCSEINEALFFINLAAGTLAFMCFVPKPPPLLLICPIAGWLGLMALVLSIQAAIICNF